MLKNKGCCSLISNLEFIPPQLSDFLGAPESVWGTWERLVGYKS